MLTRHCWHNEEPGRRGVSFNSQPLVPHGTYSTVFVAPLERRSLLPFVKSRLISIA